MSFLKKMPLTVLTLVLGTQAFAHDWSAVTLRGSVPAGKRFNAVVSYYAANRSSLCKDVIMEQFGLPIPYPALGDAWRFMPFVSEPQNSVYELTLPLDWKKNSFCRWTPYSITVVAETIGPKRTLNASDSRGTNYAILMLSGDGYPAASSMGDWTCKNSDEHPGMLSCTFSGMENRLDSKFRVTRDREMIPLNIR